MGCTDKWDVKYRYQCIFQFPLKRKSVNTWLLSLKEWFSHSSVLLGISTSCLLLTGLQNYQIMHLAYQSFRKFLLKWHIIASQTLLPLHISLIYVCIRLSYDIITYNQQILTLSLGAKERSCHYSMAYEHLMEWNTYKACYKWNFFTCNWTWQLVFVD